MYKYFINKVRKLLHVLYWLVLSIMPNTIFKFNVFVPIAALIQLIIALYNCILPN